MYIVARENPQPPGLNDSPPGKSLLRIDCIIYSNFFWQTGSRGARAKHNFQVYAFKEGKVFLK